MLKREKRDKGGNEKRRERRLAAEAGRACGGQAVRWFIITSGGFGS
jgi:hypothetical protein